MNFCFVIVTAVIVLLAWGATHVVNGLFPRATHGCGGDPGGLAQ
jgi:hypothetical protein